MSVIARNEVATTPAYSQALEATFQDSAIVGSSTALSPLV
jgi:hypothetical protein